MMKLLCALMFGCTFPVTAIANPVEKAVHASVFIEACTIDGCGLIGSGVAVHSRLGNLIVTAGHVATAVEGDYFACSLFNPSECVALYAPIMLNDGTPVTDWAVYRTNSFPEGVTPAKISNHPLALGDRTWTVGTPNGEIAFVSEGNLAWVENYGGNPLLVLDGFSEPGSSGGGVFNSKGQMVGIVIGCGITTDPMGSPQYDENRVLVVPVQDIKLL